mgnify:CR=1 FL=1
MLYKEGNMKRLYKKKCHKGGFTLVELITVLVILAILASLLIPALTGYIDKARKKQVIAETRMLHTALQTVMSEYYSSDGWAGYANIKGTAASDKQKYFIADKTGSATKEQKARYDEIIRLAEVPSLSNSKGQFCSLVTETGKVMVIIYKDGRGHIGIYFGETQEYIAYDEKEFTYPDAYIKIYQGGVFYSPYYQDAMHTAPNPMLTKTGILYYSMGYKG